jgi:hypothetical protein
MPITPHARTVLLGLGYPEAVIDAMPDGEAYDIMRHQVRYEPPPPPDPDAPPPGRSPSTTSRRPRRGSNPPRNASPAAMRSSVTSAVRRTPGRSSGSWPTGSGSRRGSGCKKAGAAARRTRTPKRS